jgi:hypothetical protein
MRLLFVVVCKETLEICSSKFFRHHFAQAFLSLASDSVSGVRKKLIHIFPAGCRVLRASTDDALLKKIKECSEMLQKDESFIHLHEMQELELEQDQERENEENHAISDEMDDCRRKDAEIRRIVVSIEKEKEKDRKRNHKMPKSLQKETVCKVAGKTSLISSAISSTTASSSVPASSSTPERSCTSVVPSINSSSGAPASHDGKCPPSTMRRPRLRSANAALGNKEPDGLEGNKNKSVSNYALNGLSLPGAATPSQVNWVSGHKSTGTSLGHGGSQKRLYNSDNSQSPSNSSNLSDKRKEKSTTLKLPALSKNAFGR